MQYEKLYAEMVGAAEQAVEAIERGTDGSYRIKNRSMLEGG